MQTNENGEYAPSKELDKNFRIPKRKEPELGQSPTIGNIPNPFLNQVLINSYYNNSEAIAVGNYQCPEELLEKINRTIDASREKPKTYNNSANILRRTIPDIDDSSLPRELRALFQPLYCKLCSAQLSSNVNAKLHYMSKNHEKKIRKYLIEYSEKTGEPLHKRARVEASSDKNVDDPKYFYCDLCDLPLTGKTHAESHYMGRNHQKVLLGHKTPAGKGHYSVEGKWIRQQSFKPSTSTGDNFGLEFHGHVQTTTGFKCDLCNITTTCQEQLEIHYLGQKHQKKLRQQKSAHPNPQQNSDNILSSVLSNREEKGDLSVYRTPSGNYYCKTCNLSLNSEIQLRQHLESKSHFKKLNQQHSV